ncbi:hypothetical protein Harman_38600 [Haloarcula mannanilytica]|uniref:Uncharacterized protein n=1 Tax=Haloarcula mannanilytica TaxID=2509225 RepID=A0A4C2ENK8_9EURY|nr:hypothetical protein Harman_38600 [Haloarcula mannanilytica]
MSVNSTPETVGQHHSESVFESTPTLQLQTKVASFVERVLVGLRHEPVATRYVTNLGPENVETIWCRAEYMPLDVDTAYIQI